MAPTTVQFLLAIELDRFFEHRLCALGMFLALCLAASRALAAETVAGPSGSLNEDTSFCPKDYGAKADGRTVRDASMSACLASVSSDTAAFTQADTGKYLSVIGAGPDSEALTGIIVSVQSATSITLSVAAVNSVPNATIHWATDDRAAIQATINAASLRDRSVVDFGDSSYWIATAVASPWYDTTGIDVTSSVRRKSIRFVGKGAKLVRRQITGKGHTAIFTVRNNWDFVRLRWNRISLGRPERRQRGLRVVGRHSFLQCRSGCHRHGEALHPKLRLLGLQSRVDRGVPIRPNEGNERKTQTRSGPELPGPVSAGKQLEILGRRLPRRVHGELGPTWEKSSTASSTARSAET